MAERASILVTPTEKKILASIRELPEGRLKTKLEEFLVDLTVFVRNPKCAQVQADGVPCDSAQADCEQCMKVEQLIADLQHTLAGDTMERSSPRGT